MKKRVTAWFAELKRIGGEVDLVLSDFEMGYHSSSYNWAHQPTADGSDPVDKQITLLETMEVNVDDIKRKIEGLENAVGEYEANIAQTLELDARRETEGRVMQVFPLK